MKKGFTLIELLAVIVILSVILVIAVPQVLKIVNDTKTNSYNNELELMKSAASIYIAQYPDEITDLNNVTVSLATLQSKGLMDTNVVNPVTKQAFDTGMNITVRRINDIPYYEVYQGPELVTGMIPVYWDDTNSVWKKADKSNLNNSWYDYSNEKWANAVTVLASGSHTRSYYQNASVGETIPMADINTMFVWIPRYSYMIPAGSGAREILVQFETKYTPKSTGDAINTYYTHPAFTFGSTELNGIWVGKFETTGTTATPTILPDAPSLRNITVKAMYDAVKNNMQGNATYGFNNTDSDIHMMKNTEWGAVALLSGSRYGKYGNPNYTGANKEIYLNNSSGLYTGRSMGAPGGSGVTTTLFDGTNLYEYSSTGYYTYDAKCALINASIPQCTSGTAGITQLTNKYLAYGASTTGNIYGIYDMSGGVYEYVMGMYKPTTMSGITDSSGYSSSTANSQYDLLNINSKYYNQYLTNVAATGSILGDATSETSSWYNDNNVFISSTNPWPYRGCSCSNGNISGIYAYRAGTTGVANGSIGFRTALSPNP